MNKSTEKREEGQALSAETIVAHDAVFPWGAVAPPIYQTSLFTFSSVEAMVERFSGKTDDPIYSRADNPTVVEFEKKIARLEGAEAARAFSSGMGAISSSLLSQAKSGDRIVCVKHVYPDAYRLFLKLFPRLKIQVEFVDGTDLTAVERALPGARILYLESPTSVVFEEQNLPEIVALAKKYGVMTMMDNSWATPIFQKPLACGIDLVIHSASKYISGHSDTVAGVVAGDKKWIEDMNERVVPYLGAKLSPFEGWLLLRGMRTLPLRMKQHQENGLFIAKKLAEHESVAQVNHPGLSAQESPTLQGYSSLFSIELKEHVSIATFCNRLKLFKLGVSWGGYESLVFPMEVGVRQAGKHNSLVEFGVSPRIVRLHVGLEGVNELWEDLSDALKDS